MFRQARYEYPNDQPTSTLWFHDHVLGITRLNVYAAGAGFWLIRTKSGGESGLLKGIILPFPSPPTLKAFNTLNPEEQADRLAKIREIPIAIQPKSFYTDGSLFYPANRQFFEDPDNPGTSFDNPTGGCTKIVGPAEPPGPLNISKAHLPAHWGPEFFPQMMVVNGRTWPKHNVVRARYRFRLLNAADSQHFNLALKYNCGNETEYNRELPFYVIGTEQGLRTRVATVETSLFLGRALVMGPGQRLDVVVDFGQIQSTCFTGGPVDVILTNTAPTTEPFDGTNFVVYSASTPMQNVMKFVVQAGPARDLSTPGLSQDQFQLCPVGKPGGDPLLTSANLVRQQVLLEAKGTIQCGTDQYDDSPFAVLLGKSNSANAPISVNDATALYWMDKIQTNPRFKAVEDWVITNFSADVHPIHLHLVKFQVLSRVTITPFGDVSVALFPWEKDAWLDTVLAYPNQRTTIRAYFDRKGLHVWHCHILSHEDNEMMLPMCIGLKGQECPGVKF